MPAWGSNPGPSLKCSSVAGALPRRLRDSLFRRAARRLTSPGSSVDPREASSRGSRRDIHRGASVPRE
jgi:hypothetical protein